MATYLRPSTLSDVLQALAAGPRAILAGGTDHYPARAVFEPIEDILDLTALPGLSTISRGGATHRIPALVTWTSLIGTPLPPLFDGLKQAASQVGGRQIQNAGTVVGNVCNASPAADGIPALLALDAQVELQSLHGTRLLPLQQFILGPRRTARRDDELVTALLVPEREAASTFQKLGGRAHLVISITMVATTLALDPGGRVAHAAIAVGSCGPVATRLSALERALFGHRPDPSIVHADHLAPLTPIDDPRAPAAYRKAATLELLRRALSSTPMRAAA